MSQTPLDIALDRLIADAGGFNRRDVREHVVNLRLTTAERELLDKLADNKGLKRIELIRWLLGLGVGRDQAVNELNLAAAELVRSVRRNGAVNTVGRARVVAVDEALVRLGAQA